MYVQLLNIPVLLFPIVLNERNLDYSIVGKSDVRTGDLFLMTLEVRLNHQNVYIYILYFNYEGRTQR